MQNNYLKVRVALFGILVFVIVVYTAFQAQKLLTGPVIEISTPQNGATFSQTLISIEGHTKNISHISLDDRPIFTDKNGYFQEKILLSPGYNVIKLDAEDKFKNKTEKRLELVLKEY